MMLHTNKMTGFDLSFSCDVLSITVYKIILWDKQQFLLNVVGKLPKKIELKINSCAILLRVDSTIQFILMLSELIRIQYNFILALNGAVRIELNLLWFCFFIILITHLLLHVDSTIQFILILNELLKIQYNFILTLKGAVMIELNLLLFYFFIILITDLLLHVDSTFQFILILNELLRIQYNFILTLKRICED